MNYWKEFKKRHGEHWGGGKTVDKGAKEFVKEWLEEDQTLLDDLKQHDKHFEGTWDVNASDKDGSGDV